MASVELRAEMAACFGYDLDTTFHQPSLLPIRLEGIEGHVGDDAADAFNGLDNIGQARNVCAIRH